MKTVYKREKMGDEIKEKFSGCSFCTMALGTIIVVNVHKVEPQVTNVSEAVASNPDQVTIVIYVGGV